MTTKSVVVTGASFGLAKGTVAVLIREDWQVFGSCVSKGAAEALQREFGNACVPLTLDVTDEGAVRS